MSRTALGILSTANLLHNLSVMQAAAPNAKIIAMVKANAYGHGLRSVSLRLSKHVGMLGVASIDEALALRKAGIEDPILLAEGVFEPSELVVAAAEGFEVVFHDALQVEWLERSALSKPLSAWIKFNTGLGRLGFSESQGRRFYERLMALPSVEKPVKVLSHFACAEDKNHPLNQKQIDCFSSMTQGLDTTYSFCNSAGILNFPETHFDYVRPGITLYGASPIAGVSAEALGLKPVMTLQASIIAIHRLSKGESVGYGARYQCPQDMLVGVVAFGYGDGYPRSTQDGAPVLVNNVRCPLVGRVSMDMLTVDLTQCPNARVGDLVILWGQGLPVEEVASYTAGVNYDILTGVQNRVKFLWTPDASL